MINKTLPAVFLCFSCVSAAPLTADETSQTDVRMSQSEESQTGEELAKLWGLDASEWDEYQLIMKGPRGTWTPNLDPITVLGINAKSEAERNEYAEKLAKLERARVTRELEFEIAYQKAQKRLFGHIPLYKEAGTASFSGLGEAKKYKKVDVFINSPCIECEGVAKNVLNSGVDVDFYFSGFNSEQIKGWAVGVGVTPAMISKKRVTLNFDGGRSKAFGVTKYPHVAESR